MQIAFDNSYAALPAQLFARQSPIPVPQPRIVAWNAPLAALLGLPEMNDTARAQIFAGNTVPDGAAPLAQLYAGHQFGHFNPQLGDGRAILLGEVVGDDGRRRDIQLKGSGPTPWSRGGDGRAWLGPVLREYVISEAMYALGIPTTRALAATLTGAEVRREDALPGAVLTRVAASHIRVGTFQALAARRDLPGLRALFDHARARHAAQAETPLDFLKTVIAAQARLVAEWMRVGFIHGVMNTDNCAISGETIDYGPCAFLDSYHPDTVFSSIDRAGRYAFSNQPDIIVWNMAQLATALVPLMPDTDDAITQFTAAIHAMPGMIREHWLAAYAAKVGITTPQDGDEALIADLLALMAEDRADFTNTFRALSKGTARDQFTDRDAFDTWRARWQRRIETEPAPDKTMRHANPAFIPRNHRVEQMIRDAVAGDYAPMHRLLRVLAAPYDDQPPESDLKNPPAPAEIVHQTFCGT